MEIINSQLINSEQPLDSARDMLQQAVEESNFAASLANCHTPGMDSIVLQDNRLANGGMARVFIAHRRMHALGNVVQHSGDFVLGVHNHRFPITIVPLLGKFINYEVAIDPEGPETLHEYAFTSGIGGTMTATYRQAVQTQTPVWNELRPGEMLHMAAPELHTVVIPDEETKRDMTAWLVLEEPEQASSLIYSPTTRLRLSSEGLYQPIGPREARSTIRQIISEVG